ncbi:MAG: SCO6880 family protein, partial [Kineosporiaceae bacterium]
AAAHDADPGVATGVPWAMAGPCGAEALVRHYTHDAWSSVSATLTLPARGAAIGALAPVLTPSEPGERRCLLVAYPILAHSTATRASATSDWAADMGTHLRARAGVKPRAAQRHQAATAHGMDAKLARGNAMSRPYAVATVTVPATARISEFGRRLDASIRRAGFAPLRLDLAQDAAFAASCLPLGISLTQARP